VRQCEKRNRKKGPTHRQKVLCSIFFFPSYREHQRERFAKIFRSASAGKDYGVGPAYQNLTHALSEMVGGE